MNIDGRAIAEELYATMRSRVAKLSRAPRLAIITCAPNFETERYLALKQKKAALVGIATEVITLPPDSTTENTLLVLSRAVSTADSIVVQLPLPQQIDTDRVLRALPTTHDADVLNVETTGMMPPVVGAIRAIMVYHKIAVQGKSIVVLGNGRLVGTPTVAWLKEVGASVNVLTKDTEDIGTYTRQADIVICGAGVPGLLVPSMVKAGAVIIDAGTSESNGMLRGDADPTCGSKVALFTPVPGGVGPVTIAILLSNVVELAEKASIVV